MSVLCPSPHHAVGKTGGGCFILTGAGAVFTQLTALRVFLNMRQMSPRA